MRLIDADELIEEIKSMRIWLGGKDIFKNEAKESIIQLIEDEPTVDGKQIRAEVIEECARIIENSKTLFENHQTETIMRTKDKCITMIRNLKEQNK